MPHACGCRRGRPGPDSGCRLALGLFIVASGRLLSRNGCQATVHRYLGLLEMGGLFETLVLLGLRSAAEMLTPRAVVHYWRTTTGKEVPRPHRPAKRPHGRQDHRRALVVADERSAM